MSGSECKDFREKKIWNDPECKNSEMIQNIKFWNDKDYENSAMIKKNYSWLVQNSKLLEQSMMLNLLNGPKCKKYWLDNNVDIMN